MVNNEYHFEAMYIFIYSCYYSIHCLTIDLFIIQRHDSMQYKSLYHDDDDHHHHYYPIEYLFLF